MIIITCCARRIYPGGTCLVYHYAEHSYSEPSKKKTKLATADAKIAAGLTEFVTAHAENVAELTELVTADATIVEGLTELVTANAKILATLTKSVTVDAEQVAGPTELVTAHEKTSMNSPNS